MISNLIDNELNYFISSLENIKSEFPEFYSEQVKNYTDIANQIKINEEFDYINDEELLKFEIRKKFLENSNSQSKNFFTITSKDTFTLFPSKSKDLSWGISIIYSPLNDHSRQYLHKGDVLFCYRQGQFDSLSDALDIRGIYGVGIAASDPIELFPNESKHNKWGLLVCFPLQLPKHLDLRNIQMHPNTIDLTPYNGNRNDALQYIPNEIHYKTLMDLIYSKNPEIQKYFKVLFPKINFNQISLPSDALEEVYSNRNKSFVNENVIINSFIKWSNKEDNYKKSYDGLLIYSLLKYWDETFFENQIFKLDISDLKNSYNKIESKITNIKNKEWEQYSYATNRGAPEAILGKNNYLKFLKDFISDEGNIRNYSEFEENLKTNINIIQNLFRKEKFFENIKTANLFYYERLLTRFICSLLTKPFVILTGLSGSGKTKLAQAFAIWICESKDQYCIVPVGADWTNREPLLGFPNALKQEEYVKPDHKVLDLIMRAIKDSKKPYFLILDEMNLSHVERYFADFLSVMETKKTISLHSNKTDLTSKDGTFISGELTVPDNLFIIGTVNIDETTYMFSPKVLDRANVIEFRISEDEIKKFLKTSPLIDLNKLLESDEKTGLGASMAENFLNISRSDTIPGKDFKDKLVEFFNELKKIGAEFGYRSASDISRLIYILEVLTKDENKWDEIEIRKEDFIDIAIIQKLLPKLHGSRSKLNPILTTLAKFCVSKAVEEYKDKDDKFRESYFLPMDEIKVDLKEKIIYPLSLEKITRMHKNAVDNGYTSYAEA